MVLVRDPEALQGLWLLVPAVVQDAPAPGRSAVPGVAMKKLIHLVTSDWLEEQGACTSQVKNFEAFFPRGATWNTQTALKAIGLGFPMDWFVTRLECKYPYGSVSREKMLNRIRKAQAELAEEIGHFPEVKHTESPREACIGCQIQDVWNWHWLKNFAEDFGFETKEVIV